MSDLPNLLVSIAPCEIYIILCIFIFYFNIAKSCRRILTASRGSAGAVFAGPWQRLVKKYNTTLSTPSLCPMLWHWDVDSVSTRSFIMTFDMSLISIHPVAGSIIVLPIVISGADRNTFPGLRLGPDRGLWDPYVKSPKNRFPLCFLIEGRNFFYCLFWWRDSCHIWNTLCAQFYVD